MQAQQAGRQPHVPSDLGWEPLDLTTGEVDFTSLLKGCSGVDQSVLGVEHQLGGSLAAYNRWSGWMQEGLNLYAGEPIALLRYHLYPAFCHVSHKAEHWAFGFESPVNDQQHQGRFSFCVKGNSGQQVHFVPFELA